LRRTVRLKPVFSNRPLTKRNNIPPIIYCGEDQPPPEWEQVTYECFIFSNKKEMLDMGFSYFDGRINNFVLTQKTETHSGTDNPIFFDKSI
jgi:hypothetical protein